MAMYAIRRMWWWKPALIYMLPYEKLQENFQGPAEEGQWWSTGRLLRSMLPSSGNQKMSVGVVYSTV
ncbi:hypothetical protein CRN76_04690 [Chryseobacterium indologenes]|nr:hypothetical protein CRN76_04690 [Chryseobacterium indologenes]